MIRHIVLAYTVLWCQETVHTAFGFTLSTRVALGYRQQEAEKNDGASFCGPHQLRELNLQRFRTVKASMPGQQHQQRLASTSLKGMWSEDEIEGIDRYKACIPYLLPLIDGDRFGRYIYERIPPLAAVNSVTVGPLAELAHNVPFLTLLLFMALTLGTRFDLQMSRNVRFSAQQAAMIDLFLIVPELIASLFENDPLPRSLVEPLCTFVWYTYVCAVVYSVYNNLRGKKPDEIPYVSGFAEIMVGPF